MDSEFDLIVARIVSAPDSHRPWMTLHSVYVVGQPRWQAPLVRPLVGDELQELTESGIETRQVLTLCRVDGRGYLRLLFDPDRVTVSGNTADNPSVNDARRSFHRSLLESASFAAGRSEGRVRCRSMGAGVSDAQGTFQAPSVTDTESLTDIVVKIPRVMTSHNECTHEKTKEARAACRKARRAQLPSTRSVS